MMDEPHAFCRSALMNGLFESIENEPGMSRAADAPADDPAGEGINHESHVNEPLPSGHIGEIRSLFGAGTRNWRLT